LADLLRAFPLVLEVPLAWGDMDAMRHVNNTVYFRWFESARIAYFHRAGFLEQMESHGIGPILASTRCKFRIPLTYPDTVRVGASAGELREDRFVMRYAVASRQHDKIAAEGEGLIVSYDYRRLRKAPLPDAVRRAIEKLEVGAA
jgi:acyl-CoA thioester hydrolase